MGRTLSLLAVLLICNACTISKQTANDIQYKLVSGIYPHLAYYNDEGECGTGAVVPWQNDLWVITYGPHLPLGSSDKLYQVNSKLEKLERTESTGGTPANRLIHKESNQLFIGPYAIDRNRNVRVIPYQKAPGRYTGAARHLFHPDSNIYIGTMEEGFYDINVNSLNVKMLFPDGNAARKSSDMAQYSPLLPGVHGKGLYSGQGVLVYSNNGEDTKEALSNFRVMSGSLAEWNGAKWEVVRRNQFVEVTGPGGIYGNSNPKTDPIWATGWDHKSVLLGVRGTENGWSFFRLPKASNSYDGAHGWNTEWPRIRDVGDATTTDYLMTMHGMFWKFPETFSVNETYGVRPRSSYLKVIGDFARWNGKLVFGCDDSAQKEFLNKRKAKGKIGGPGQSNSNLWFTEPDMPDKLGPATAFGSVWENEQVVAGTHSEPFLFAGWDSRFCWIRNYSQSPVEVTLEVDKNGDNNWQKLKTVSIGGNDASGFSFSEKDKGEWIRAVTDKNVIITISFAYTVADQRGGSPSLIFNGLATAKSSEITGGLLYGLGDNRRKLGVLANRIRDNKINETGYYELDEKLNLVRKDDPETAGFIRENFAIPKNVITQDDASILVIDDSGRRWRLPKGSEFFNKSLTNASQRVCREVATERDLFNCAGTFYELPAENADGYAKIRPVSSHNFFINDYASYRGMLVLTGIQPSVKTTNEHIITSNDGLAAVWVGAIDDLWKLGKPVGSGGPWNNSVVKAETYSDPYLIGFYDRKDMKISHNSLRSVTFRLEVDPTGNGEWIHYKSFDIKAQETLNYEFPHFFQARWIRFSTNTDTKATISLNYR